jgi:hypothetical protein
MVRDNENGSGGIYMIIDLKKASYTELWELLTDIGKVLEGKTPDKTSVIYVSWVKVFNAIRREIDKRMSTESTD